MQKMVLTRTKNMHFKRNESLEHHMLKIRHIYTQLNFKISLVT